MVLEQVRLCYRRCFESLHFPQPLISRLLPLPRETPSLTRTQQELVILLKSVQLDPSFIELLKTPLPHCTLGV